jgi:hypothetical protein
MFDAQGTSGNSMSITPTAVPFVAQIFCVLVTFFKLLGSLKK